jgi:hypothetical protein
MLPAARLIAAAFGLAIGTHSPTQAIALMTQAE